MSKPVVVDDTSWFSYYEPGEFTIKYFIDDGVVRVSYFKCKNRYSPKIIYRIDKDFNFTQELSWV